MAAPRKPSGAAASGPSAPATASGSGSGGGGEGRATSASEGSAGTSPTHEGRYRIHVVAEKTGVPAATLRAWERRYGIPFPARTESSYRLYSDHDVELVRLLNQHCAAGMAPAEAARLLRASDGPHEPVPAPTVTGDPFRLMVRRIVDAALRFDPEALEAEISHALALGPASAIFERIVVPVQQEIGERWHAGTLSVGHEHWVTESLGSAMRALHRLVQPPEAERLVVLACFAEEDHTLPLYGVAFRLASWGHRTVVLGSRTPPSAIEPVRVSLAPDLIGLSVTVSPPASQARALVEAYAAACGPVPWAVGGHGASALASYVTAAGGMVLEAADAPAMRVRLEGAMPATAKRRSPR